MKKVLPLVLSVAMLLAACGQSETSDVSPTPSAAPSDSAPGEYPPPILDFKIGDGVVDITDRSDSDAKLQSIPFDKDLLTDDNREYFVKLVDMNFDGYTDVQVLQSQGLQNIYYDAWLWVRNDKKFVLNAALSALCDPSFNVSDETISTFEHISATDYTESIYSFKDDVLVEQSRVEQAYDAATDEIVIREYGLDESGKLEVTSEKREPASESGGAPDASSAPDGSASGLDDKYRGALASAKVSDPEISGLVWSEQTFAGANYIMGNVSGKAPGAAIPVYLVDTDSLKVYRAEKNPQSSREDSFRFFEIYPDKAKEPFERVIEALELVEFGSTEEFTSYDQIEAKLSPVFTPEFTKELMTSVKEIYQPDDKGVLRRVADRGSDITLGNYRVDVIKASSTAFELRLTAEYYEDGSSATVHETKDYDYKATVKGGATLFEKCELFF